MVLRGAEGDDGFAIGEREETGFLSVEELLDHHLRAGRAELAAEHVGQRGLGFGAGLRDHNALARRQPVRLEDIGRLEPVQRRQRFVQRMRMRVSGGGDARPVAQRLGKGLGPFQLRRRLARPEHRDAGAAQIVRQPCDQRRFRADDDQADGMFGAERDDRFVIARIERCERRFLGDAGVAGGGV